MADLNKRQPGSAPAHVADPIEAKGDPKEVATAPSPKGECVPPIPPGAIRGNGKRLR